MKAGWQTKKLIEFSAMVSTGPFGSILHKSDYVGNGVPLINPINIVNDSIVPDSSKLISAVTKRRLGSYVLKEGDIVVARRGEIGRCAVVGPSEEGWVCGTGSFFIRPLPSVDSQFLAHLIRSNGYREQLEQASTGTTMKNLSNTALADLKVSLPSLSEQQRIVGILDEAFDGIATAKANAEKNLQNARALFESHLQAVFTQRGEDWEEKLLDDVCIVERGSSPRPIKNFFTTEPDGVNWIKIGDTVEGEKYIFSTKQKITPTGAKQSRFVKENDFILTNSMSFGRPYIMKTSGYIHDGWFVLRLKESINLDYFYYLLASSFMQAQFKSLASGAIVLNISGDLVKKAKLPMPPLIEQQVLAQRFQNFSAETQRLESIYRRKLAALDELKKSLLHKAFNGEL